MKKFKKLIVPIAIVVILAAFAGAIYYSKVIKPAKEVDEMAGYNANDYIELGKYKDFKYVISQKKFDDLLAEKTYSAETVDRAAKKGDEVEVSYTGLINKKKVDDLSQKDIGIDIGDKDNNKFLTDISNAVIGCKKGDIKTVKEIGAVASKASKSKKKYKEPVTFKVKVLGVSEVTYAKVTDEWVKDESDEDVDTAKEFYDVLETTLDENAMADLWQRAIDNAKMSSWPPELYKQAKEEEEADAAYNADQFNMTLDEWYAMNNQTEEDLDKEYLNSVKSTLVMWAIVKKEHITASDDEITEKYNELFEELKESDDQYKTIDDVKKDYSKDEIREAVLLQKCQQFVYDNSTVKKTYKVPQA